MRARGQPGRAREVQSQRSRPHPARFCGQKSGVFPKSDGSTSLSSHLLPWPPGYPGDVLHFASAPEPTSEPLEGLPDASAITEWFDGVVDQIIPFLIVLVFTVIIWFVGVLVINGVTR